MCPLRKTDLRSCRANHRPIAPTGAGGLSTEEVDCRLGYATDTGHQG